MFEKAKGGWRVSNADQLLTLLNCATEQDWCDTFFALGKNLGFEQVLFGIVPSKYTPLESAFLRSSYAHQWRDTYDSEKLHYVDPTVGHCLTTTLPLTWAPDIFKTTRQKQLYEEACGYGIRSGFTFPIHGVNGEFGVISFACDMPSSKKFSKESIHVLPELALVRDYAIQSSLRFTKPSNSTKNVNVTQRELAACRTFP